MKHRNSNFTFSRIPSVVRPRSVFDRSRTYKTAFDAGLLIPFYVDEILPGDTIANLNVTSFARLSTPVVPFIDNLWMDFHFFFVPSRLVWSNWRRFCGEQDNPGDSTDYLVPQVSMDEDTVAVGSVYDYFGIPPGVSGFRFSALPLRAYNLIWNEFYRDENLQDSVEVNLGDGPDSPNDYKLLPRGKRKSDPFASALPWPQKGPGVEVPLGDTAPVRGNGTALGIVWSKDQDVHGAQAPSTISGYMGVAHAPGAEGAWPSIGDTAQISTGLSNTVFGLTSDPARSGLVADLSHATAMTINSLRTAFQVQKWYEQLARGGSRYQELLLSMFGTDAGDNRLQRPEYLGGGTVPIQIHAVAQTSASDDVTPQGNLAAYGVSGGSGIGFSKSFVEHGFVIGLVSVRADLTYQQGLDRMWSRRTKFDYYWPAFAHLGEVPILNKEIYLQGTDDDDKAFGYQERWYEYRYGISKITGKLRSQAPQSLDVWHLAQYFGSLPTLSADFVRSPPSPVSWLCRMSRSLSLTA